MNSELLRGIEDIIDRKEFEELLAAGRPLRIKFGVDPTSPDLHIGHAVVLRTLRRLQDMGHTIIFLIGDYTTKIGDPSGKSKTRPMLTDEEIARNVETYLSQVDLVLDTKKAEIRYNSEWLGKLDFSALLGLASQFSVAQLIEREDFRKRLSEGVELSLHELLYPVMQAYDSVALEADVEFGGTDQLFNLMAGRALQKKMDQRPQQVVTMQLLVGTDGHKKMSKSLGNYIGLTDAPADMYGKVMSIPDPLIVPYYELCTDVPAEAIEGLKNTLAKGANPRDSKASLAREIVRVYHGETAALEAEEAWNRQFREGGRPEDIPEYTLTGREEGILDLLTGAGLAATRSEARRLIGQGGVRLDDEVLTAEAEPVFKDGQILQVGKRRYLKLRVK